jgi:hypothetical protein
MADEHEDKKDVDQTTDDEKKNTSESAGEGETASEDKPVEGSAEPAAAEDDPKEGEQDEATAKPKAASDAAKTKTSEQKPPPKADRREAEPAEPDPTDALKQGLGLLWQAAKGAARDLRKDADKAGVGKVVEDAGRGLEAAVTGVARGLEQLVAKVQPPPPKYQEPGEWKAPSAGSKSAKEKKADESGDVSAQADTDKKSEAAQPKAKDEPAGKDETAKSDDSSKGARIALDDDE